MKSGVHHLKWRLSGNTHDEVASVNAIADELNFFGVRHHEGRETWTRRFVADSDHPILGS